MLDKILDVLKRGKKCILIHANADPDALGSAIALSKSFPDVTIGAIKGLSKTGKFLQKALEVEVVENPDLSGYDEIIIVDVSAKSQLGSYGQLIDNPIIIDHHRKTEDWDTALYYCDENKHSCAEIVYELFKLGKCEVTEIIAKALLVGMLTDTGGLRHADGQTLRTFAEILDKSGLGMDDAYSILEEEHATDYSRKISMLKGAQRLKLETVDGRIVTVSQIGAFESDVCNALIRLGTDVAFVGSQRDENFRISARARKDVVRAGFNLADFLMKIGKDLTCEGGGHAGAAGLNGSGDVEAMLNICMEEALKALKDLG